TSSTKSSGERPVVAASSCRRDSVSGLRCTSITISLQHNPAFSNGSQSMGCPPRVSIFAMVTRIIESAVLLLSAVFSLSQQPAAPTLTPDQARENYRASKAATLRDDFGELSRYRDANAVLNPPAPGENRVVFFGDSITDIWHLDEYF